MVRIVTKRTHENIYYSCKFSRFTLSTKSHRLYCYADSGVSRILTRDATSGVEEWVNSRDGTVLGCLYFHVYQVPCIFSVCLWSKDLDAGL